MHTFDVAIVVVTALSNVQNNLDKGIGITLTDKKLEKEEEEKKSKKKKKRKIWPSSPSSPTE